MKKTLLFQCTLVKNNACFNKCLSTYSIVNSKTTKQQQVEEKQKDIVTTDSSNLYYKEFMKLLKKQKEPPFLYSGSFKASKQLSDLIRVPGIADVISKQTENIQQPPFGQLGVTKNIELLLNKNGIKNPLHVQRKSLPILFQRRSAIIESATGTGKTLTYLLPILQDLGKKPSSNIVIVPTRELASQVFKEALKYVPDRDLVVRYVSGINEEHERKLDRALRKSHIIVGTPKRLLEIFEEKNGHFRNVRRIVLDEVDKLLPLKSMGKENISKLKPTEKLLSMLVHQNKRSQLIATSATVSRRLVQELQDQGFTKRSAVIKCNPDGYEHGMVPGNIRHNFVVVPDDDQKEDENNDGISNKVKYIGRLFRQAQEKSVLVFIPKHLSVQTVVDMFAEMQFTAVALYKQLLLPSPMDYEKFTRDFEKGEIEIVVSTEETVRGLDFPFVNQTYLTYVPESPEDYLHVAGRVGRVNKIGTVTTVINDSDKQTEKRRLKKRFAKLNIKGRSLVF